jgi:hypothetical protein
MTERRRLSHKMLNGINTLVLTTQCLPISEGDEIIEHLNAILNATDSIVSCIDALDALPDEGATQ